ncbi:MAG: hypothetical protein ABFD64_00870 [Armatimonadota bacterium]
MRRYFSFCGYLIFFTVLAAAFLLGPAQSCAADNPNKWQWEVTPYYWPADISGDVGVRGVTLPVNVDFSDIKDHLDTGILLNTITTRPNNNWGYIFDLFYLKLSGDKTFPAATVSADSKTWVVEFSAMYSPKTESEVKSLQAAGKRIGRSAFYGGLRYVAWKNELDLSTGQSGSADEGWVEPMVGYLTGIPLAGKLNVVLRGDIGGFGVGKSDFTWDGFIDFRYQFSKSRWVNAGYRWLGIDTLDNGEGGDLTFKGPLIGITSKF